MQRCHPSLCLVDGYNNRMPEGKELCITSFLNSRCNIKIHISGQTEDPTQDIQTKYNEFQKACSTILPKIDRKLVEDLLYHQQGDPNTKPKYFIEVTTKEGLDTQK